MTQIQKGDYVTHASRHYPPVYKVLKVSKARALVEFVGEVVNGHLSNFSTHASQTYRDIDDLQLWQR